MKEIKKLFLVLNYITRSKCIFIATVNIILFQINNYEKKVHTL